PQVEIEIGCHAVSSILYPLVRDVAVDVPKFLLSSDLARWVDGIVLHSAGDSLPYPLGFDERGQSPRYFDSTIIQVSQKDTVQQRIHIVAQQGRSYILPVERHVFLVLSSLLEFGLERVVHDDERRVNPVCLNQ